MTGLVKLVTIKMVVYNWMNLFKFSVEMDWIDIRDKCHRVAMTPLLCNGLNLPLLWCITDLTMTLSIMMSSGVASNEHISTTMDSHSMLLSLKPTLLILTEWYCNIICPCFICFFFPLFHRNLSLWKWKLLQLSLSK